MKYAYFPGCSLKSTGRAYEESLRFVFRTLDIELVELKDWNCCGATTVLSVDDLSSYALAARNLAIAKQTEMPLLAPCASCYLVFTKTQRYVRDKPIVREVVTRALKSIGLQDAEGVEICHPLDVLANRIGVPAVAAKVTKPLKKLTVAPYYGCQLVRPYSDFDDPVNPQSMDRILRACGATVAAYPLKTECCGASQKSSLPEIGLELISQLIGGARRCGADVIATACPLCQFNLEVFQPKASVGNGKPIPILYFTQLVALSFGAKRSEAGLQRSLIPLEQELLKAELSHA